MLVIDASALVDLLRGETNSTRIAEFIADRGDDLHAPQLYDLETLNALRRAVLSGRLSQPRADDAVEDLIGLPVQRHAHPALTRRIWELRHNFSAYDAAYLALTEVLAGSGAALLTTDARLARAVRKHSGVEVLLAA
jgi:predicted nucleic acid-binding protein